MSSSPPTHTLTTPGLTPPDGAPARSISALAPMKTTQPALSTKCGVGDVADSGDVYVRELKEDEWWDLSRMRLKALEQSPESFASTLSKESAWPEIVWRERLRSSRWFLALNPGTGKDVGLIAAMPPRQIPASAHTATATSEAAAAASAPTASMPMSAVVNSATAPTCATCALVPTAVECLLAVAPLASVSGNDDDDVGSAAGEWTAHSLWVDPTARRCGVARALLLRVHQQARLKGAKSVALWVARGNGGAQALYANLGYLSTGVSADDDNSNYAGIIRTYDQFRLTF
jgi:ribosomal protein S18 acetylase RimI-like enzyme